ncbi:CHASE2 domain-containing protein [Aliamphritea spongicola]|uniref:CHASE2 domain-containing protein n=1 Tax=Aliamphritea spongicola TaxID=707589 RepID=UPI00196B4CC1|nr:adenylate/guanylate cyclase domain-containing protein [Aliamphritea spongicola]MBN3560964.1 adenylate/guanylate cyclase domain-containing protein [Aliamphritea spongicola]
MKGFSFGQRMVRSGLGLLLTLLMLVPLIQDNRPVLLERFESDLYDLRLRQFLADDQDPRIVIVDIDEASLAEQGRWPWGRATLANMLNNLFDEYGVAIVGFDMLFAEADRNVPMEALQQWLDSRPATAGSELSEQLDSLNPDRLFAAALEERPVVLGYVFDRSAQQLKVGDPGSPVAGAEELAGIPVPRASGVVASLDALQTEGTRNGFIDNPRVDADGVYRRVPLLQEYQSQYYPSLALAMILALFEEDQVTPLTESDGDSAVLVAVDAAGISIPVDNGGSVLVPYRGRQGSFPYVSATDVINGRASADVLEGAIVLVGTSAAGLLDLRVTPVGSRYAGVEVHANIIAGILDEQINHRPDYTLGVELLQVLLSGLLLSLLIPRTSVLVSGLLTLLWVGMLTGFNLYAWQSLQWVIPLGYSLFLVVLLYLFLQITGYFFETRNIRKLEGQFGQYIPPEVVAELSEQGDAVQLSGESREMTVFFSDIRDFTSLSEQLTPQQLTRMMNIYLTAMTAEIHQRRGTVDKYIGDAVMAFWGAPLEDAAHARHSLQAAMDMLDVLPELNRQLVAEGLPEVSVGMGINTGQMNVGNMGSSFRMAYTVMGDAVNLASRLEGLTKFYNCPLLVSDETAASVPEYGFRYIDRVRVKGRFEPVDLYQPIGKRSELTTEQLSSIDEFCEGVRAYQQQRWDEADAAFRRYLQTDSEDYCAQMYLLRIAESREAGQHPWDGIYSHQQK